MKEGQNADDAKTPQGDPPGWRPHTRASRSPTDTMEQTLAGVRSTIYSRSVSGVFARWRVAFVFLTQLIFYGLPWLQWNGRQAVLFDLGARKFYLFGLVLWPQDVVYLAVDS